MADFRERHQLFDLQANSYVQALSRWRLNNHEYLPVAMGKHWFLQSVTHKSKKLDTSGVEDDISATDCVFVQLLKL